MKCDIEGVIVRELTVHSDERGWLIEAFRKDGLGEASFPAMGYVSSTRPGVARGPHEHREQADHFCFVGPSTFKLYLWDNRKDSATYGSRWTIEAGETRPLAVLVPPGVVHAYRNVGVVDGMVYNVPNRMYRGEGRQGPVDEVRHENDPDTPFRLD